MKSGRFLSHVLLLLFSPLLSQAQVSDEVSLKLNRYAYALEYFGRTLPQEKIYVHFDNTSYYQGDHIWFQCYVVTSGPNQPAEFSQTLYIELLNPGGEAVAKRILPIKNGRCHGDFHLTHLPFYSGFYEVRAYTKYMMNFGEESVFSRIFPVFEQPQSAGDFEEKKINTTDIRHTVVESADSGILYGRQPRHLQEKCFHFLPFFIFFT